MAQKGLRAEGLSPANGGLIRPIAEGSSDEGPRFCIVAAKLMSLISAAEEQCHVINRSLYVRLCPQPHNYIFKTIGVDLNALLPTDVAHFSFTTDVKYDVLLFTGKFLLCKRLFFIDLSHCNAFVIRKQDARPSCSPEGHAPNNHTTFNKNWEVMCFIGPSLRTFFRKRKDRVLLGRWVKQLVEKGSWSYWD